MKTFEQITNDELVANLGPDDLMIHARHIYLSAAKDLLKDFRYENDQLLGEDCLNVALKIQEAIDCWDNR